MHAGRVCVTVMIVTLLGPLGACQPDGEQPPLDVLDVRTETVVCDPAPQQPSCLPDCAGMTVIPAGTTWMGCDEADEWCSEWSAGEHQVSVPTFAISITPVTKGEFVEYLNHLESIGRHNVCEYRGVEGACLEWGNNAFQFYDGEEWAGWWVESARQFEPFMAGDYFILASYCQWRGMRLPTEHEWQRAVRGESKRRYPWGDEKPDGHATGAWSGYNFWHSNPGRVGVVAKNVSAFGLLDTYGYHMEFTSSYWDLYPPNDTGMLCCGWPFEDVSIEECSETPDRLGTGWNECGRAARVARGWGSDSSQWLWPRTPFAWFSIGVRCAQDVAP